MAAATAIAIGSTLAGTVGSFVQAAKQRNIQKQAEADAAAAMAEARKQLEKNYYDVMGVKKEPYELEREAMLAQGAQAIQAGVESERGAAATAGKVQMAMNEGQAGIRTAMGQEMTDIEKLKLAEDARLRDVGVQLDLEEAGGQQQMAADAQRAAVASTAQGFAGITSAGQQVGEAMDLYGKTKTAATPNTTASTNTTTATPSKMTTQVPSSKLNISSFQKFNPTAQQIAESNLENSSYQYGKGSKFGSPIKTPSWTDAYNYFNF